jgi:Fe-S oxidoreductase
VYEAPRAVLGRALGRTPDEFDVHERRESGVCSGAGGLLPATMPEVAKDIAGARVAAHARLGEGGGGRIVTACASSLIAMRKSSGSSVAVDDLVSWIARALS